VYAAGTPAQTMLRVLGDFLDGNTPKVSDVLLVQSSIFENMDIYKPVCLEDQLRSTKGMDVSCIPTAALIT
jgi:hypothetical protein